MWDGEDGLDDPPLGLPYWTTRPEGCTWSRAKRRALVRRRLEELLLLDTNEASAAAVTAHLERCADALRNVGETMATRGSPRPRVRSDVCAALAAMPDELQLAVLRHLSDYDVVALLACRKAPCFSEATCYDLLDRLPSTARSPLAPFSGRKPRLTSPFDVPHHDLCPFRELRRRSYQRGVTSKYAVASPLDDGIAAGCVRWTSADVPGDTVLLAEVVTRLAPPCPRWIDEPDYVFEARSRAVCADAHRRWWRYGKGKPRWFPPLVRVTEQGNPTDGRVGQFVRAWTKRC